jgi:two-component sensor histidine kinase
LKIISPKTKISLVFSDPEDRYVYDNEFYNVFEFKEPDKFTKQMFLENVVDPESFINELSKFQDGENEKFSEVFEYIIPDSEKVKTIYSYLEHYPHKEKDYLIGFCQDISESVKREEDLKKIINEKTVLMKEFHHRVKNNLQILSSFLNLEEKFNKNEPEKIIQDIKSYIESLALIHEKAYSSENVGYVNVKGFLEDINSKLCSLFSKANVEFDILINEDIFILIDILTPLSLIVNELTINSIKHAFISDNDVKKICNSLHINENGICEFIFKDNGIGLPEDFDTNTLGSLGWTIITALSSQLDGTFSVIDTKKGAGFKFNFPIEGKYMMGGEINGE